VSLLPMKNPRIEKKTTEIFPLSQYLQLPVPAPARASDYYILRMLLLIFYFFVRSIFSCDVALAVNSIFLYANFLKVLTKELKILYIMHLQQCLT